MIGFEDSHDENIKFITKINTSSTLKFVRRFEMGKNEVE